VYVWKSVAVLLMYAFALLGTLLVVCELVYALKASNVYIYAKDILHSRAAVDY
jgi:hypothetical protein